jgi:hypothetical protein
VTAKRDEAVYRLEVLLNAVGDLEQCLRETKVSYGVAIERLAAGTDVADALDDAHAARTRQALTAALDAFEQHRHRARLSLTAAGIEEGMTINAISRAWGISRQLASRDAKEARAILEGGG